MTGIWISLLADWTMLPIVVLSAFGLLFLVRPADRFKVYTRLILVGLTSFLVAKLAGAAFQPDGQRPFERIGVQPGASYLDNPGFPSDHALFTTFLVFAVWYATGNRLLTAAIAIFAMAGYVGRVLALVHTPLDIFGGVAAALVGALWYLNFGPVGYHKTKAVRHHGRND